MTVLEAIQKSADFLAKKGVDSPRLQTELLLAHLLKLPRMKLYLNFERALTPAETDALRELVKRRSQHEPLQHLTGSTSFCGFEITVNRHALVPRPETELLAEAGWEFFKSWQPSGAPISDGPMKANPENTPDWSPALRWLWTSAPAPVASPSPWPPNVPPPKSLRPIFPRTPSRWPGKTPRATTSPNELNFCREMGSRRYLRRGEFHEPQNRK